MNSGIITDANAYTRLRSPTVAASVISVNTALAAAKKDRDNKMGTLTQGVKMPGMF